MNHTDTQFTGSIPETYDRYLEPLLFGPYARDLATRARAAGPRRVLEVACGTGIVTRALAKALPEAEIEATDLNDAMVSFASSRAPPPNVRWSAADAMSLPFDDGSFDLVVCQFGVMFFPDRVRAFRDARRVLKPGGTYLFSVWDCLDTNDVTRVIVDAAARMFPDDPPTFIKRIPHGHGDCAAMERDLRAAGFGRVECETVVQRSRADSARDAAFGLCHGTPMRHEIVSRDPGRLDDVVEVATRALRDAFGDGAIDAPMCAFVFAARE